MLFAWANEAVSGLPAYTTPACPLALNGEPAAVAEEPGVAGFAGPHVFAGAPGWPVAGLTVAHAEAGAATRKPAEHASTRRYFRICFLLGVYGQVNPFAAGGMRRDTAAILYPQDRPVHARPHAAGSRKSATRASRAAVPGDSPANPGELGCPAPW